MTPRSEPSERPPGASESTTSTPVTMWFSADCPFGKDGAPVLGNSGASIRRVVIFEYDEWLRLAKLHPTLETQQFRVGTFE